MAPACNPRPMIAVTARRTSPVMAGTPPGYRPYCAPMRRALSMRPVFAGLRRPAEGRTGGAHGPLLRPDQMPARPVLRGGEPAGGRRTRLRNLFDRRRVRPAGEILRRG